MKMNKNRTAMYRELEKSKSYTLFAPYKPIKNIYNWWDNIRWFFRSFKLAAQRIKRGYSDYDLNDFGDYLTRMAARGLEDFRIKTDGYTGTLTEEEWDEMLAKASANFFLSIDELQEFNWNKPQMPGTIEVVKHDDGSLELVHTGSTKEEYQKWYDTINTIDQESVDCGRQGWEWFSQWYSRIWY